MAAAERHNRCVVDAGRFHHLVIDIPPDPICPRCDLIFNDGHELVINAETSDSASGGNLWQKIRDRWRARRAERETKTHQTAGWRVEGRRGDGRHELGVERERQGQTHRHEAAQRRPQDSVRPITTSSRSQRRSLHVLDDQTRGARVQETERAIARLLGAGDSKGKRTWTRTARDSAFTGLFASVVGERQRGGSAQRGRSGKLQANMGRFGAGEGIRPGTPLQAGQCLRPSSVPSRARHQRGRASRTHSCGNRTNRSASSSRSGSKRSFGTGTVSSDRTELKKVNFVAASRPISPDRSLAQIVDWRKILRRTKN